MSNRNKSIVYIDGQNFLFRAAEILAPKSLIEVKDDITAFDFRYLFENALKEKKLLLKYYGTRLKHIKLTPELETKTTEIINATRQLKNSLAKQGVNFITSGRLKLRDSDICKKCGSQDQRLQEKGVDVDIAVDMVSESQAGYTIYLVSSDTDLLPAVKKARAAGAEVVYVGFAKALTHALTANADRVVVLREAEIWEAFKRVNPSKLIN